MLPFAALTMSSRGQAHSRHQGLASKESLVFTGHQKCSQPTPQGRKPQKSQKGGGGLVNKYGHLPCPNSPGPCGSHTAGEVPLFSECEVEELPAQKGSTACYAHLGAHTPPDSPAYFWVALEPADLKKLRGRPKWKWQESRQAQPGARGFFPSQECQDNGPTKKARAQSFPFELRLTLA